MGEPVVADNFIQTNHYATYCPFCGEYRYPNLLHLCKGDDTLVLEDMGNVGISDGMPRPGEPLDIYSPSAGVEVKMSNTKAELEALKKKLGGNYKDIFALVDSIIAGLVAQSGPPSPPWRDIHAELPTNSGPYGPNKKDALNVSGGWWQRTLDQIDGVTIHHTLSHSPHATATHYIKKGYGRPTIPYTFWVTQTGEVLLCVALEQGLWHDHTGHKNTHLSIGLAGHLHQYPPPEAQIDATVKLCVWAIDNLPNMRPGAVRGHSAYAATICPGWSATNASGNWETTFFDRLDKALERRE